MSNEERRAPGRRFLIWVLVAVVLVAIGIVITLAVLSVTNREAEIPATSPTPTASPSPTTPLPSASPGSTQTVEPEEPVEVPIDATAEPVAGVTAAVTGLEAVEGEGRFPGETSGPAIRVTFDIRNGSGEDLNTAGTTVNLEYGPDHTPAVEVGEPGGAPFPDVIAAGESAQGIFIFTVPLEERDQVRIILDLLATAPAVLYVGVGPTS